MQCKPEVFESGRSPGSLVIQGSRSTRKSVNTEGDRYSGAIGGSMSGATYFRWLRRAAGVAAMFACAVLFLLVPMTEQSMAQSSQPSGQRPLAVVSVSCGSDLALCRALIQVLAEAAPSQIYRINPRPRPPQAFDLRINQNGQGQAQLIWSGSTKGKESAPQNGRSEKVTRSGMSDLDLSRALLEVSPGLSRALQDHQARSI